jgi:hypothetical protein
MYTEIPLIYLWISSISEFEWDWQRIKNTEWMNEKLAGTGRDKIEPTNQRTV